MQWTILSLGILVWLLQSIRFWMKYALLVLSTRLLLQQSRDAMHDARLECFVWAPLPSYSRQRDQCLVHHRLCHRAKPQTAASTIAEGTNFTRR